MKQPMQPVIRDGGGVPRFQSNALVRHLLYRTSSQGCGLDELSTLPGIAAEDWMQLAQLIGYSVDGYAELSYASEESIRLADEQAAKLLA